MATSSEFPYFPFWANDWLLSESRAALDLDAQGVYILLLCLQWRHKGLNDSPIMIRKAAGIHHRVFPRIWGQLAPLFPVDTDGRRRNHRLEEEREKIEKSLDIRRKGGAARAAQATRQRGRFNQQATSSTTSRRPADAPADDQQEGPKSPAGDQQEHQQDTSRRPASQIQIQIKDQDQDPATADAAADHLPVETVENSLPLRPARRRETPLLHVPPNLFQAFVRDLLATHGESDEASIKEAVKAACAARGWVYNATIISTALRREDAKRRRESEVSA